MNELKKKPVWVNWKRVQDIDEKTKKPKIDPETGKMIYKKAPINPKTGELASTNKPATWASYEAAGKVRGRYDGIGFAFADGICGIDIDKAIGDPQREAQAKDIIDLMDTYTEYSPSGTGYHIILKCDISKLPQDYKKAYYQKPTQTGVECYISGMTNRYFTYTGEAINDLDIEDRTEQLLTFLDKYMRRDSFAEKKYPSQCANVGKDIDKPHNDKLSDSDIISIAKNSKGRNKFIPLFFDGDTSQYNNDDSSADMALCNMLAFYCPVDYYAESYEGDFDKIDSLFRQSELMRDKWDRKQSGTTYGAITINKAIERQKGFNEWYKPKRAVGRPKKEKTLSVDGQTEFVTIENLTAYLQSEGIIVRYNEITHRLDIDGIDVSISKGHSQNALPTLLFNKLRFEYEKVQKGDIKDFLDIIALHNRYNPVLEMIHSEKWDKRDRLPELFNILGLNESDRLSRILVYKWLWQCLSMAKNISTNTQRGYGADGLLVLVGNQGIGKTSFFRALAMDEDYFVEGKRLNMDNKDTIIQATAAWITELGEIGSTFRSDLDSLKAFITNKTDQYRKPYGHSDLNIERKTSFCGTCNDMEYLIDPTGNRRFWSVPVDNIKLDILSDLNVLQLWAQVEELTHNNVQGFRLTQAEQAELALRNSKHEKPLKSELEVRDIFDMAERRTDSFAFKRVTVSEFKMAHEALKNYSVQQIGQALKKIGVEESRPEKIDGKTQRLRLLPVWKNTDCGNMDTEIITIPFNVPDSENPFLQPAIGNEI